MSASKRVEDRRGGGGVQKSKLEFSRLTGSVWWRRYQKREGCGSTRDWYHIRWGTT